MKKATIKRILFGSGIAFGCLGLVIILIWKIVFPYFLVKNIALKDGSLTEQTWIKNTVPIYFKVYMFNWSNPEQTLSKKENPNFVEMGPYTFKFLEMKSDIVWNNNSTLTFSANRLWTFVPEMSNGKLSDHVTNINALAVSIGDRVENMGWLVKDVLNEVLELFEGKVYITKTVEELLFEGYKDRLLNIANYMKSKIPDFDIGYLPEKFGWYFKKNITETDIFNIHTGADNINMLGKLHSWNYTTECGIYNGECDKVRGSLGDLWPMNISAENTSSLFISDFCGAFDLTKTDNKVLNDLTGVHFLGTVQTFDNGIKYSENRCYCKNNTCEKPSGVRDVSGCVHGPIYLSFPHFYLADESYREHLNGMNPAPEKHQFSVLLQEDSGIVMEIFARLQINVDVNPNSGISFFSNLPKMMFPTIWFEEHAELPNDLKSKLTLIFTRLPYWFPTTAYIFGITGCILALIGSIIFPHDRNSDSIPYTSAINEVPKDEENTDEKSSRHEN